MPNPTESEAREVEALELVWAAIEEEGADPATLAVLRAYAEAVRATEREKYDEQRNAALVEAAATVERTFGDGGAYGGSKAYGWLAIQQLRLALEPFMEGGRWTT